MENNIKNLLNLYKTEISRHIPERASYAAKEQMKTFASFFNPGSHYFYILNFENLKMEYASEGTKEVLGIDPDDFSTETILGMITPEAMKVMEKKEKVVVDFLTNFIAPDEIKNYKVVYLLKIKDRKGKQKTILHQVNTLTTSEAGKIHHVMGVHTDISNWKVPFHDNVSLIHIDGGTSYYHLDPENEKFDPEDGTQDKKVFGELLTKKETEIIRHLIKGLSGKEIAAELNISTNTMRTHRNNILRKTGCSDTPELVAKSIMQGII